MNMSRLTPYLGIAAGLICGMLIITLFNRTAAVSTPAAVIFPIASSTIFTTSTQATSLPEKTSEEIVPTEPISVLPTKLESSASALRAALINIICRVPTRSASYVILGSGVIIDPKGIILTNAHVAQYFLLADRGVSCTIRSGSPATDRYDAALIYISPAWLRGNPHTLTETSPNGTGEDDFALLAISQSATKNPLPVSFPFLPLAITPLVEKTPVAIASYGAQFLEATQVMSDLFPTVVFGSVRDVFTFSTNTIDVLSFGGSAAAQEGSSGGGVVDRSGKLVGTVTTSLVQGDVRNRALNAITASYIRAEYATETGQALDLLLAQPTTTSVNDFAPQMSALESIITANLR